MIQLIIWVEKYFYLFVWLVLGLFETEWHYVVQAGFEFKKLNVLLVYVCGHLYATGHMWWSEEDCEELVLSCHFYLGPRA